MRLPFRRSGQAGPSGPPPPLRPRDPVHVIRYSADEMEEWRPATLSETRALVKPGAVTWIDVNRGDLGADLDVLSRDFGVHPLTLDDLRSPNQRPKVEEYPGYLFVVTTMLKMQAGRVDTEQVGIILGDEWLVTIQEGKPGDVFDKVRAGLANGRPLARASGTDHLLYLILDALVEACFPILEDVGARAEALEDVILESNGVGEDLRVRLQALRRDLLTVRRIAWPQRDALALLERGELPYVSQGTRPFLRDVHDTSSRVIDFVETNRDVVASLMDLHLAQVAQRTNEVMRVLTVVTTVFVPLTFIVGWYGMNFEHMPELRIWWAYPAVLLVMGTLAGGMALWFRRKGWV